MASKWAHQRVQGGLRIKFRGLELVRWIGEGDY